MATLTIQQIDLDGIPNHTYTPAAGGGDVFANDGKILLAINRPSGSTQVVTVNSQRTCNQGFDHDVTISTTSGDSVIAGPFDATRFNNASGQVELTYDGVTGLEVAVLKLSEL